MNRDRRGYFYRSQRIGGRVVREYLGKGEWCGAAAQLEACDRQSVARERSKDAATRRAAAALDSEVAGACDAIQAAMRAELQRHGYRQHARGQWRKQRMNELQKTAAPADGIVAETMARIRPLLEKADGDAAARREIFELLEAGRMTDGYVSLQCVAQQAQISLLKSTYGDQVFARECEEKNLAALQKTIAGENPTPLESLLARRITLCWFHLYALEALLAQTENASFARGTHYAKRLDGAHKRYLSAIKALAEVRKMQLPSVQMNFAEKQVNLSG
jgi:hypothetical protein